MSYVWSSGHVPNRLFHSERPVGGPLGEPADIVPVLAAQVGQKGRRGRLLFQRRVSVS